MHEFRKYLILSICIASCVLGVLIGVMQMIEDKRDETGFNEVRWDMPRIPYYRGGSTYRAPSSSGSMVTMPRVSSSSYRLFHHQAGDNYAGQESGTYRSGFAQPGYSGRYASATGQSVRTFSNSTIHSYGGGGASGGMIGVTSHRKAPNNGASAGYTIPGVSISVPRTRSYAYNSLQGTSSETPARLSMPGRRKVAPDYGGEDGELAPDTEDGSIWWYWDEGGWTTDIPVGMTRPGDGGVVYRWNGTSWETEKDQEELDSPVGDIPWILLLLMVGGYTVTKSVRRKSCEQE